MPSEYVVRWSGGRIGSGASVFHFAGTSSPTVAQAAANAVQNFFTAVRSVIPVGITMSFDAEVRVLSESGVLTAVIPVSPPAAVTGNGSGAWANGTGMMVRWNTASVVGGRRLLGRTFLVPIRGSAYTGGNLDPTVIGTVQAAADALIAAMSTGSATLQVWSRKNSVVAAVSGASVPTRPSTLRTRNDRA